MALNRLLLPTGIICASLALASVLYSGLIGGGVVRWLGEWDAASASAVLNILGASTTAHGTVLSSSGFAVDVAVECLAIGPLLLFVGAVLAYPSTAGDKCWGAMLGVAVLTVVNVARIASLFWFGERFPQYLDVAHLLVWQAAIVVLALMLWMAWARVASHARAG